MKRFTYVIPLLVVLLFVAAESFAQQTEISAQIRPRYEMRNGFNTLKPDNALPAHFISQRTRLNLKYSSDVFDVGFSVQNVGVWGETSTTTKWDVNGSMVHEAWAAYKFNEKISLKVGRQMFVYDDHRIFGSLDWAQQARSFDAALLRFKGAKDCKLDLAFAYNANRETRFKEPYTVNNFRTLQFAHWHKQINGVGISVLVLNNGLPWMDSSDTLDNGDAREKIAYSQTIGTRLTYKNNGFKSNLAFYYQTGKVTRDTTGDGTKESAKKLNGINVRADIAYAIAGNFTAGVGVEYLSGTSMKDPGDTDNSFKPLYGTNHKFNGFMDYFYVGNHMNSVGLSDIFITLKYTKNKFAALLVPHFFGSAADIYSGGKDYSPYLGTEIDFVISYSPAKNVNLKAGYSQMFATESMQVLKGGNYQNTNNWAWVMIDFKPTFFKSDKSN